MSLPIPFASRNDEPSFVDGSNDPRFSAPVEPTWSKWPMIFLILCLIAVAGYFVGFNEFRDNVILVEDGETVLFHNPETSEWRFVERRVAWKCEACVVYRIDEDRLIHDSVNMDDVPSILPDSDIPDWVKRSLVDAWRRQSAELRLTEDLKAPEALPYDPQPGDPGYAVTLEEGKSAIIHNRETGRDQRIEGPGTFFLCSVCELHKETIEIPVETWGGYYVPQTDWSSGGDAIVANRPGSVKGARVLVVGHSASAVILDQLLAKQRRGSHGLTTEVIEPLIDFYRAPDERAQDE